MQYSLSEELKQCVGRLGRDLEELRSILSEGEVQPKSTTITVLLADPHSVVRGGVRELLEKQGDFVVVGEANDGLEAAKLVVDLQPDVLVVELMMGGMNGIEVARHVTNRSPKIKTVILSMYGNGGYVMEALRVGVKAYVLKEATASELFHAIREVMAGRRYFSAQLLEQAANAYLQKQEDNTPDPDDTLTTREREMLSLLVQDCNIMNKLQSRTCSALHCIAKRYGVVIEADAIDGENTPTHTQTPS